MPFGMPSVNVYALLGDRLVLIDAGPNWATALDELERELGELGFGLCEVETIVLTHHHVDHTGLVASIVTRSGAKVVATPEVARRVRDHRAATAAEDRYAAAALKRHGTPDQLVQVLTRGSLFADWMGSSFEVDRGVDAGEVVVLSGRSYATEVAPGHSETDTVFVCAEEGFAFTGDVLLAHQAVNPLLAGMAEHDRAEAAAVARVTTRTWRNSLDATVALGATRWLPGHGTPITDPGAATARWRDRQDERAGAVLKLLDGRPATAFDLASRLPDAFETHVFVEVSDVVGSLELLIAEGTVAAIAEGPLLRYARNA
jgi:glyoxylase-like metal-dependent hydrolase (beta-lactamase superfamily II)